MNTIRLKAIPTFRILDYKKAVAFYVEQLGFTLDWEHRFGDSAPVYMQVSKNDLVLHLSENERFRAGVIVFVETGGIEALRKEFIARYEATPEIQSTSWGTKQMEIEDPFGNLLRFNEEEV